MQYPVSTTPQYPDLSAFGNSQELEDRRKLLWLILVSFSQFIADYSNRMADVSKKIEQQRQVVIKAETRLKNTVLRSPVEGTVQQIRTMFTEGKITESQMNELIVRQLKQQKIFAFGSYDEFFNDYFKRDLVAVEDLNRARLIINARKQYEKRKRSRIIWSI